MKIADTVENAKNVDGFLLLTGTDAMEEAAFFLDCVLTLKVYLLKVNFPGETICYYRRHETSRYLWV